MTQGTRMLLTAGAGVVAAVAVVVGLLALDGRGDVELRLGSDTFTAGRTDTMAESIARDGPITFPGLEGGDRPIIVHHLGDDPESGWVAFEAHAPGAPLGCVLSWDAEDDVFIDPCTDATYPASGMGLMRLAVRVDGVAVVVDLRHSPEETTTTTRATVPVRRG